LKKELESVLEKTGQYSEEELKSVEDKTKRFLESIKNIDPDDEKVYKNDIIDILKDIYGMDRWGNDSWGNDELQEKELQEKELQEKELQNKPSEYGKRNLYQMLFSEVPDLFGKGIYYSRSETHLFGFDMKNKGYHYTEFPEDEHVDISSAEQKIKEYIDLFELNLDLTNYFIKIISSESGYTQKFLFEITSDRRTKQDFVILRKRIDSMNKNQQPFVSDNWRRTQRSERRGNWRRT